MRELTAEFGAPVYTRIDAPATPEQKALPRKLSPTQSRRPTLAGEPITATLTRAPATARRSAASRSTTGERLVCRAPSGTENVYKLYAESFRDAAHLERIVAEARRPGAGRAQKCGRRMNPLTFSFAPDST